MKNSKQIMSDVTITFDNREVAVDGVEFWTRFYEEAKKMVSVLEGARDKEYDWINLREPEHYANGIDAINIVLTDFESMMLADAKAYMSGVNKSGELYVDDYIIAANSQYLNCIGVLMQGMVEMIKRNIATKMNTEGLSGLVVVIICTCKHFIEKEDNK